MNDWIVHLIEGGGYIADEFATIFAGLSWGWAGSPWRGAEWNSGR